MTQPRIDWKSLSYRPGDTLRATVVVPDALHKPPRSITWAVFYNASRVSSGVGREIAVHGASHGVYKVEATLVDHDGAQSVLRSAVSVSGGMEARAVLPPPPFTGSMAHLGTVYSMLVTGPEGVPPGSPAQLAGLTQVVYLPPGTTHISFGLDQADTDGDVVVRTRAGNWALFGGERLSTEDLGFSYRVDAEEPVPAPKDLKLQLTTEVYHVNGGYHAAFNVRVKVICWRQSPQLYRYEACAYTVHPEGSAGVAYGNAVRLAAFFEVLEIVQPDGSVAIYTIPQSFSIPATRMASSGLPSVADRATGLGFTESNRGVIYESLGLPDLDAFAVAGIPGIRPGIVSVEKGGLFPVVPRITRARGRLLLYAGGAAVYAGTKVKVEVETGKGLKVVNVTVPKLVAATAADMFVLAGSADAYLTDFQFAQTGLVTHFTLDTSAAPLPVLPIPSDPRMGADYIYSKVQVDALNFAGICYVNPEPRRLVEDIEAIADPVIEVTGCQHTSCGPQGLYCYSNDEVQPSVSVVATDPNAAEGGNPGVFTFTRTGPTDVPLAAFFAVSGSARAGIDYADLGTFVSFGVGVSVVTKTVNVISDILPEPVESITVVLEVNPAYALGTPSVATVYIDDATPVITVVASGAASEEGAAGTFTFTRTAYLTDPLTIAFTVSGSATSGTDYTSIGTTVTFAAGSATATKTVTPLPDALVEGTEFVTVTVAPGTTYAVGNPSAATVYITDSTPVVRVTATDASATEAGGTGMFTFTRTGSTVGTLTVNFVVSGSATSGTDYVSIGTTVVFGIGQDTAAKVVTPIQDAEVEGDQTVTVTLAAGTGYNAGNPSVATVYIIDDDQVVVLPVVTVSATDSLATEWGDTGVFTFSRTGSTTAAMTVNFTVGGTATAGTDYADTVNGSTVATTVTFPVGASTVTKTVNAKADAQVENFETVIVTLATGTGYAVGSPSTAVVYIEDRFPTITVFASEVVNTGTGPTGTFTFNRTGPTTFSVAVYFTVSGSAVAGTDYTSIGNQVFFGIGQNTVTRTVTSLASTSVTKIVRVSINETIGYHNGVPSVADVYIEAEVPITVFVYDNGSEVFESTEISGVGFYIAREDDGTALTDGDLEVTFNVVGQAIYGVDYHFTGTPVVVENGVYKVTIPDGLSSVVLNVQPHPDTISEGDEAVVLQLVAKPGYKVGRLDVDGNTINAIRTIEIKDDSTGGEILKEMLHVALAGGVYVDGKSDENYENYSIYYLNAWRAPSGLDYNYVDGSSYDNDPIESGYTIYPAMLKDALGRVSGRDVGTIVYSNEVGGVIEVEPPGPGDKDTVYAESNPTHDGYSVPVWLFLGGGTVGAFPHTAWPGWRTITTPMTGWWPVVYTFNKAENDSVRPGRWDFDVRVASGEVIVPGTANQDYTVNVRVRGIAQRSVYTGGVQHATLPVYYNGSPANADDDVVKMTVSTNSTVYYLNSGGANTVGNMSFDYLMSIQTKGGAKITLEINNQDGFQYRVGTNGQDVIMVDPPLPTPAADTVWIQLDIELV